MRITQSLKNRSVRHAICIGSLCSVSYLAVYFARNILGAVTPQMIEGGYTESYIGTVSSVYFTFYAIGQLLNGAIGDRIKARYMISAGLFLAGITNFLFPRLAGSNADLAVIAYGFTGFFLSMIFGPVTKTVAENTEPHHATRCSLGYTFASFIASPLAGVAAAALIWQDVFLTSSAILVAMAILCFAVFLLFERRGIIRYNQFVRQRKQAGSIRVLLKHRIIKFTLISILTGVVRTTVVFWMPTYISQHLGFTPDTAAVLFTGATFVISFTTFVSIFVYETVMKRDMDKTILLMFSLSAVFFALLYFIRLPAFNIALLVLAIMSSNAAASMLWSRYCPGLRDTGIVSGVTGFLDFVSYMAASASTTIFSNAVSVIGWGNLILVWCGLMVCGVVISLPIFPLRRKSET